MPNSYTPVLLLDTVDFDQVRAYIGLQLGANTGELKDLTARGDAFAGQAELQLMDMIEKKRVLLPTIPTFTQIVLNQSPAVTRDFTFLKNAATYYIAYLYAVGITSNVNTAVQVGEQQVDLGGIGAQWILMRDKALQDADNALKKLTNWSQWRKIVYP